MASIGQQYHELLDKAFAIVADPKDWKAPIDTIIRIEDYYDLLIILTAIEHFTATKATYDMVEDRVYHIKSVGYRAGPAGDH